jgi:PAS domain-containing protein
VTNAAGHSARMRGSVLDITARKKTEVALREANVYLATVIESSPLAIASIDADDTVWTWNSAAEHQFGWSAPDVLGRPLPVVPVAYREAYAKLRGRVLRGESVHGVELIRQKRDATCSRALAYKVLEPRAAPRPCASPSGTVTRFTSW